MTKRNLKNNEYPINFNINEKEKELLLKLRENHKIKKFFKKVKTNIIKFIKGFGSTIRSIWKGMFYDEFNEFSTRKLMNVLFSLLALSTGIVGMIAKLEFNKELPEALYIYASGLAGGGWVQYTVKSFMNKKYNNKNNLQHNNNNNEVDSLEYKPIPDLSNAMK